jgi:hypothetical protein
MSKQTACNEQIGNPLIAELFERLRFLYRRSTCGIVIVPGRGGDSGQSPGLGTGTKTCRRRVVSVACLVGIGLAG